MTDDFAIEGEDGGYVPCGQQAAQLVVDEEGAISGSGTGFVAPGGASAALPATSRGAIVGSGVGFVPGPCRQIIIGGFQFGTAGPGYTRAHLATSQDAILWNNQDVPFLELNPDSHISAAAWSPDLGQFLIGGGTAVIGDETDALLATSPDGVDWTLQTVGFSGGTGFVSGIAFAVWSPELGIWLIGGSVGTYPDDYAQLATSPDGITWTLRDPGFGPNADLACGAWSPELGLFVIGGTYAVTIEAPLATSPDGVTWTLRAPGFAAGAPDPAKGGVTCAAWSPELGLFVIGGFQITDPADFIPPFSNAQLATSPNGVTWTQRDSGFLEQGVAAAAWSPELGLFVIGSATGNSQSEARISTSADGTTWSTPLVLDPFPGTGILTAIWDPNYAEPPLIGLGGFIVAGWFGQLWTSRDAITWTERVTAFGPTVIEAIYEIAISGN